VSAADAGVTPPSSSTRLVRWHRWILGICVIIFAFELGLFLLVFPWLPNWDLNWIPLHSSFVSNFWMNQYFRGALSGLGLLNIYVAVTEAGRRIAAVFLRKAE
jgi:hypothetical protein